MAKFINRLKAVAELEDIIRTAGENLLLVSPYLKLSRGFRECLAFRDNLGKETNIVFGKAELKPDELCFLLRELRFVSLWFYKDLHAKCYVNDSKMIITSLNMYDFSMENNREMGVLIDRYDPADAQLFMDAQAELFFILTSSQPYEPTLPDGERAGDSPDATRNTPKRKGSAERDEAEVRTGYCIRTGAEIPFNLEKPLSHDAYKRWKKYGDADYGEKYCHFSGEPSKGETSVSKPVLAKYWKKAQRAHGLK